MAFQVGNYAKVWEIKKAEKGQNYIDGRISTSRKDKDGKWSQDFGAYVRFIGEAMKKVRKISEEDTIILKNISCTNTYDKKKNVTYVNYQIFDFDVPEE